MSPLRRPPTSSLSATSAVITHFDGDEASPTFLYPRLPALSGTYFLKGNDEDIPTIPGIPVNERRGRIVVGNFTPDTLPDVVTWGFDRFGSRGGLLTNNVGAA